MPVDPAKLQIVNYPTPVLRQKAQPIAAVTDEVRAVADRMIELMREAGGIGLAAPQVGLNWRMFICEVFPPDDDDEEVPQPDPEPIPADVLEYTDGPVVYINPTLSGYSRDLVPFEEGCLSLPRIRGVIRRPSMVTVNATGIDGTPFLQVTAGMLARCLQHENDHLDGVLILEKMAQADRLRNRSLIKELEADAAESAPSSRGPRW